MTDTEILKRIDQRLERLEKRFDAKNTRTWVKVSLITELTGWDHRFLEKARLNGLIKQRKGTNGIEYLLESINSSFIKKSINDHP